MARLLIVFFGLLTYVQAAPGPQENPHVSMDNRNTSRSLTESKMAIEAAGNSVSTEEGVPAPENKGINPLEVPAPDNKGLVSDVLDAAIGGIQFGIELGATNGTLNKLCLKIGGVALSGCRRTVDGDAKAEEVKEEQEVTTAT